MPETIQIAKKGPMGTITFNRPDKLNSYNFKLSMELKAAIVDLGSDDRIRVIVITGTGKAFMAGADISMLNDWIHANDMGKVKAALSEMFNAGMLEDCPKPVIAAINGLAFGMGFEIALACDYRIAVKKAKFALPEIKLGVFPGGGGSQRLLRLVGSTHAMEIITTGDPIHAAGAYQIGLLNRIVDEGDLSTAVNEMAERLINKSPNALRACKKLIYKGGNMSYVESIEYEKEAFCKILLTQDAKEGTQAFLEKRTPVFRGD